MNECNRIATKKPSADVFDRWLGSPVGQGFRALACKELNRLFPRMPGQFALQLSHTAACVMLNDCPMPYRYVAVESATDDMVGLVVQSDLTALPIESDSMNVVLLAFTLEMASEPQQVLCEVYRVLKPGGQLIMIGLNRWSTWPLIRWFNRQHPFPSDGQFYSIWRLKRWLAKVGYGIIRNQTFGFLPPRGRHLSFVHRWSEAMGQLWVPKLGACYLIDAQKKVAGQTPLLAVWSQPGYGKQNAVIGSMMRGE